MMTTSVQNRIDVMIVNDSPYMIEFLTNLISSNPKIKVSSTARDGNEALRKLKHVRPNVILLDLEMPYMDGLTFIGEIAKQDLIPIIVVSNYSQAGTKLVLDSLEFGAVDFFSIPEDVSSINTDLKNILINKIEIVSKSNPLVMAPKAISRLKPVQKKDVSTAGVATRVIVIGCSTGAPRVVSHVLSELPADLHAGILIVQHMAKQFTTGFASRLNEISKLKVKEAVEGDLIQEGVVLVAPGDYHMVVSPSCKISLNQGPKRFGIRPSINVTMVSASEVFGANTIGVLLSGMGQDGAFGMKIIKKRHGITIAQDEASSVIFGMARAAQELHAVDKMVHSDQIARQIVQELNKIV